MDDLDYITALDDLDDLLYQCEEPFSLPPEEIGALRRRFVAEAFDVHVTGNPAYRRYAEAMGVRREDVRDGAAGGIDLVPLIPSVVFKGRDVLTEPLDGTVRRCTSSGTQGGLSVVNRDRRTLQRFVGSIAAALDVLDVSEDRDARFHVLGPDTAEAADLWFSYVLSIVDLLHPTSFHVRGGEFLLDGVIGELQDREPGVRPIVLGPPVLVLELAAAVKERIGTIDLGSDGGLVLTAGGWKRFAGRAVPAADLARLVTDVFGLPGPESVRDCFNMVELNTVIAECREHRKHIPPWLRVTARDPADLRILGPGESGMLAFLDPLPTSYPGFVLSDDLGRVHPDVVCDCGRRSDVLTVERRLTRVETRGCALKLDRGVRR